LNPQGFCAQTKEEAEKNNRKMYFIAIFISKIVKYLYLIQKYTMKKLFTLFILIFAFMYMEAQNTYYPQVFSIKNWPEMLGFGNSTIEE
jgi:hypothetical protein